MMGGLKDQERASAQFALASANPDGLGEAELVESRLPSLVRVSIAGFVAEVLKPMAPCFLPASVAGAWDLVCIALKNKRWKENRGGTVRRPRHHELFATDFSAALEQDRCWPGGT